MTDIMLDIETLGTEPGCAVLSIGACTFDLQTTFYDSLSITDQVYAGMPIDPDTQTWWIKQGKTEPRAVAAAFEGKTMPLIVCQNFTNWLAKIEPDFVWCNGLDFDIPILKALFKTFGVKWPLDYRAGRDVRTAFHIAGKRLGDYGTKPGLKHHALQDALFQAAETEACLADIAAHIAAAPKPVAPIIAEQMRDVSMRESRAKNAAA